MAAVAVVLIALAACSAAGPPHRKPGAARAAASHAPRPMPSVTPTPSAAGFDAHAQSIDDPASTWVVVNKPRALSPVTYTPPALVYPDVAYVNRQPMRPEVAEALVAMFNAGKAEAGLDFSVQSAYRAFDSQTRVYDDDVASHGQAYADTDTARPGHSEHRLVEVHPRAVVTELGEADGHPAGAAPCVEDSSRRRDQRRTERRLAVHVLAGCGEAVEPCRVARCIAAAQGLAPATAHCRPPSPAEGTKTPTRAGWRHDA